MKSIFAAALVAISVSAQWEEDSTSEESTTVEYVEEPSFSLEDLFEKNEDGRWQLKGLDFEVPKVSFNDVDDEEVEEWAEETEQRYEDNDDQWAQSWQDYQDAIAQPWNTFLDSVEQLSRERDEIDLESTEDVLRFITENTFVDGESVYDSNSEEIESVIDGMRSEAEREEEVFFQALDKIRHPTTMARCIDGHMDNSECLGNWYEDCEPEFVCTQYAEFPIWDKLVRAVEDSAVSNGYDGEVAGEWIREAMSDWDELNKSQMQEEAQLAQDQTREASDYFKGIISGMVEDLSKMTEEHNAELREQAESQLEEMLSQIESQSQENIDRLQDFIDQADTELLGADEATWTPAFDNQDSDETALLAQGAIEYESSNSTFGYAALAIAAAAAGAYFYNKKQQKEVSVHTDGDNEEWLLV